MADEIMPPRFVIRKVALTFAEVAACIAEAFDIRPAEITRLHARLRNFQRVGLAASLQNGRGKASHFTADHLRSLYIASHLSLFGVGPEIAVDATLRIRPTDWESRSRVIVRIPAALGTRVLRIAVDIPECVQDEVARLTPRAAMALLDGDLMGSRQ